MTEPLVSQAPRQFHTQQSCLSLSPWSDQGPSCYSGSQTATPPNQSCCLGAGCWRPSDTHTAHGSSISTQGQPDHSSECHDADIPSLQALRGNPGISEVVNSLLASYEGRAHSEVGQGKLNSAKRFGRYNAHDSVTAASYISAGLMRVSMHQMERKGYYTMICPYHSELLGI